MRLCAVLYYELVSQIDSPSEKADALLDRSRECRVSDPKVEYQVVRRAYCDKVIAAGESRVCGCARCREWHELVSQMEQIMTLPPLTFG